MTWEEVDDSVYKEKIVKFDILRHREWVDTFYNNEITVHMLNNTHGYERYDRDGFYDDAGNHQGDYQIITVLISATEITEDYSN